MNQDGTLRDSKVTVGEVGDLEAIEADRLLGILLGESVPPMSPAHARDLQLRVVGRIDQLSQELRNRRVVERRRNRLFVGFGGAAAALAAVACVVLVLIRSTPEPPVSAQLTPVQGAVEIARGQSHRSAGPLESVSITDDDELRTGVDSLAKASLATGSVVEVGPSTRVRFRPSGRGKNHFEDGIVLEQGFIEMQVPRLPSGTALSVRTADTLVTVHGTRFSVEWRPAEGPVPGRTLVSVTEGRVTVQAGAFERFVSAGERWSSAEAGDEAAAPPSGPSGSTSGSESQGGAVETPHAASVEAPPSGQKTSLAAENELLQHAMDARKQGHPEGALRQLNRFLSRYPDSPLAETARVERLRALVAAGLSNRATSEARRYLADYPNGFGRSEATTILARPASSR